jgi:hypothetical protein
VPHPDRTGTPGDACASTSPAGADNRQIRSTAASSRRRPA